MTINSSPSEVAEIADEPASNTPDQPKPLQPVPSGDDGATTAGGPTMVLLLFSGFVAYKVWRHRRRHAARA